MYPMYNEAKQTEAGGSGTRERFLRALWSPEVTQGPKAA